jgi:biotin---protein ligase
LVRKRAYGGKLIISDHPFRTACHVLRITATNSSHHCFSPEFLLHKHERHHLRRYTSVFLAVSTDTIDPEADPKTARNTIETLTPILSPHYSITTVSNPKVFVAEPWQSSTALVIIPGGRDLQYCRSLNGDPNTAISSWVRYQGGKFLGICAGGYFGSRRCEFAVGDKDLEVVGKRELSFFPGTCRGAAFPGFSYNKEGGARAAGLTIEEGLQEVQENVKVYCNGGGIFVDADLLAAEGITVLARYQDKVDVEGGDAAAVFCKVGTGAAVLLGVHPEYFLLQTF